METPPSREWCGWLREAIFPCSFPFPKACHALCARRRPLPQGFNGYQLRATAWVVHEIQTKPRPGATEECRPCGTIHSRQTKTGGVAFGWPINSLLKNRLQRRRRAMFIDICSKRWVSSVGAAGAGNQVSMPPLRSYGRLDVGFYKHVAPTALTLGARTRRVFHPAVKGSLALLRARYRERLPSSRLPPSSGAFRRAHPWSPGKKR